MSTFLHHIFSSSLPLGKTLQDIVLVFIRSMRRSPQQGRKNALVTWVERHKKWCLSSNAEHCCSVTHVPSGSLLSFHAQCVSAPGARSLWYLARLAANSAWICSFVHFPPTFFSGLPFPSTYSPWQRQNPGPTCQFLSLPGCINSSDVN